jgi:hypothetical protein
MNVKAKLKALYTTEMNHLDLHPSQNPDRFRIWVHAMVGPQGDDGEESFDIGICTPSWVEEECRQGGFVVGRHHLVVLRYDVQFITTVIKEPVERCDGNTWKEVAEKVSRIGQWEFEDYKPFSQP